MAPEHLTAAPGRTVHRLAPGWWAVVLHPLAGHALAFVGLFRDGADAPEVILEPDEAGPFLRTLPPAARRRAHPRGGDGASLPHRSLGGPFPCLETMAGCRRRAAGLSE